MKFNVHGDLQGNPLTLTIEGHDVEEVIEKVKRLEPKLDSVTPATEPKPLASEGGTMNQAASKASVPGDDLGKSLEQFLSCIIGEGGKVEVKRISLKDLLAGSEQGQAQQVPNRKMWLKETAAAKLRVVHTYLLALMRATSTEDPLYYSLYLQSELLENIIKNLLSSLNQDKKAKNESSTR